jgi:hypothetical protein
MDVKATQADQQLPGARRTSSKQRLAVQQQQQQQAAARPPPPSAGRPLQLICYNDETGLIEVGQEAIRALKAVKGPVGVVAVCGRARTGKSYILNQLLGEAAGFTVAASYRPCTKGLWLWSAPVQRVGPDGSPYHLILLDSEGIDAYDQVRGGRRPAPGQRAPPPACCCRRPWARPGGAPATLTAPLRRPSPPPLSAQTTQDAVQIFSLAVLLSSMFVYNQMGSIDEAALDRLSLVTELTRHIRVRATSAPGSEDSRELGGFNPTFLWLLRGARPAALLRLPPSRHRWARRRLPGPAARAASPASASTAQLPSPSASPPCARRLLPRPGGRGAARVAARVPGDGADAGVRPRRGRGRQEPDPRQHQGALPRQVRARQALQALQASQLVSQLASRRCSLQQHLAPLAWHLSPSSPLLFADHSHEVLRTRRTAFCPCM